MLNTLQGTLKKHSEVSNLVKETGLMAQNYEWTSLQHHPWSYFPHLNSLYYECFWLLTLSLIICYMTVLLKAKYGRCRFCLFLLMPSSSLPEPPFVLQKATLTWGPPASPAVLALSFSFTSQKYEYFPKSSPWWMILLILKALNSSGLIRFLNLHF